MSGKLASRSQAQGCREMEWLRGTAKIKTWLNQLYLMIFRGGKKDYNWYESVHQLG